MKARWPYCIRLAEPELLLSALFLCSSARGELSLVQYEKPQSVFSGSARRISMTWSNSGSGTFEAKVRGHVEQATSATAAAVADFPWRKLQVLPGQTVLESARVDFPDVRARTEFLIQWLDETNRVLGLTRVFVYPTNLLLELKSMAQDEDLGLFDPANTLKPILKPLGIQFSDLEESGVAGFRGKLAIIGPFTARTQAPEDLGDRILAAASKGVPFVWFQPPPKDEAEHRSCTCSFIERKGFVLIAHSALVPDLQSDPISQITLVAFCRRAIKHQAWTFNELQHLYEN